MSGGQGAQKRAHIRKAKAKQEAKKIAQQKNKLMTSIPIITEDDLLAYQFKHFGDDSRPLNWFVSAEEALQVGAKHEDAEEDDLGYYEDGVKRTLTDEQIAIFRRTELVQLKRAKDAVLAAINADIDAREETKVTPEAVASSAREVDTLATVAETKLTPPEEDPPAAAEVSNEVQQSKSAGAVKKNTVSKRRKRQQEIPYDQRNKRKWENYIAEVDPAEGAVTHRRLARELDDQQVEQFEMDY